MTEDDRFDELLARAVQDYNRPPATVPRDEMWAAIEAGRKSAPSLQVVRGGAPRSSVPRFVWWSAAAAAAVLIAAGVGIGRWSTRSLPVTGSRVASTTPSVRNSSRQTNPSRGQETSAQSVEPARSATNSELPGTSSAAATRSRERSSASELVGRSRPRAVERAPSNRPSGGLDQFGSNPYQVATIKHLADAEALLTSFRIESRDQKMDASLSTWARDLLTSTRLLLDSPAAQDPRRERLLEDLELVLAQIVQLSPSAAPRERELIEGTIRDGHVMTRLRTAIPAGPTRGL